MTLPRRFSSRIAAQKAKSRGEPEQAAESTSAAHRSNGTKKRMASPCGTTIDTPMLPTDFPADCFDTKISNEKNAVILKTSSTNQERSTGPFNNLLQNPVADGTQAAIAGSCTSTAAEAVASTLSSFHLLSKLPIEIQRLIWAFASIIVPQSSPRIHQIAPDPAHYFHNWMKTFRLVEMAQKDPQFKILRENSSFVPSLLCVCRESRRAASKEYSLWPTAKRAPYNRTVTYERDGKHVYVNKEHDIFYFGEHYSEYWFLDLMHSSCYNQQHKFDEDTDTLTPASSRFLDQMSGMRHLALEWHSWLFLLVHGNCTKWLRNLPWLRDLTLVIKTKDSVTRQYLYKTDTPLKFVDTVPNTIRADSAGKMLEFSQTALDTLPLEYPEQTLPRLHVVALYSSDQDDNSSEADQQFAKLLHINRMMCRDWREDSE